MAKELNVVCVCVCVFTHKREEERESKKEQTYKGFGNIKFSIIFPQ